MSDWEKLSRKLPPHHCTTIWKEQREKKAVGDGSLGWSYSPMEMVLNDKSLERRVLSGLLITTSGHT